MNLSYVVSVQEVSVALTSPSLTDLYIMRHHCNLYVLCYLRVCMRLQIY